jgi:hypothetical protein
MSSTIALFNAEVSSWGWSPPVREPKEAGCVLKPLWNVCRSEGVALRSVIHENKFNLLANVPIGQSTEARQQLAQVQPAIVECYDDGQAYFLRVRLSVQWQTPDRLLISRPAVLLCWTSRHYKRDDDWEPNAP